MNPNIYAAQKAFEDWAAKDASVEKILDKIAASENYIPTNEDRQAILDLREAYANMIIAKKALGED